MGYVDIPAIDSPNYLHTAGTLVALSIAKIALFAKIRLSERSELRIFANALSKFDNT